MYMFLKSQNDQHRSELDQCFLEKKSHEEEVKKMDEELDQIKKAAEDRLNELHPDQRQEYEQLQEENKYTATELGEKRNHLEEVNGRVNALEGRLQSDILRLRAQQLREVGKELVEKKDQLEIEASQAQLSIPEQRDALLAKVKGDNAEIVNIEKTMSELRIESEKYRKQIREMQTDIEERKGESNDQQKYEILFTKDQEMTSFIESFDASKQEELEKITSKQSRVVELLENISKSLGPSASSNPHEQMADMQDELDFKNKQLQNSESTQNRLQAELEKRNGELDKIVSLDAKISSELQQLETKIKQYQTDISEKFDHIDEMKQEKEQQIRTLSARKETLMDRLETMKKQINFMKLKNDGKKQQLLENEINSGLESQEQKIKQFENNLFHLRLFISTKVAESDFQAQMGNCLDMAEQVNQILQDKMKQRM